MSAVVNSSVVSIGLATACGHWDLRAYSACYTARFVRPQPWGPPAVLLATCAIMRFRPPPGASLAEGGASPDSARKKKKKKKA